MKKAIFVMGLALAFGVFSWGQSVPDLNLEFARLGFTQSRLDLSPFQGDLAQGEAGSGWGMNPKTVGIYFFFRPTDRFSEGALEALETLRKTYLGTLSVFAVTDAPSFTVARELKGLDVGFPVLSVGKSLSGLGVPSVPAFVFSDPGGKSLAIKFGMPDWSSAELKVLVQHVIAAHTSGTGESPGKIPVAPAESHTEPFLSRIETEVVAEINLARTAPGEYAKVLREYRSYIKGDLLVRPGKVSIRLGEGAKAVDEAIAFLERQKPLKPLTASRGISRAAKFLAQDQAGGRTGHTAQDGSSPFDRMNRFGKWIGTAGENCAYGGPEARDFLIQLIVDDGVPSRGHRKNIFTDGFTVVGVGVGQHKSYGFVCVQDFAGGYTEN